MKKISKNNRRPSKTDKNEISDAWEKLARDAEAEENSVKAPISKRKKPKRLKKLSRSTKSGKLDVNSAAKKLFDAPTTDKVQRKPAKKDTKVPKGKGKVDYGETLKSCATVAQAAGFLAKTHEKFIDKAQRAVGRRKISAKSRFILDGLLTKPSGTSVCIMTNPRLATEAFEHLHKGLVEISQSDPPVEMAFVTLIAGDCETPSDRPVVDLHAAQKRAKATLRAMSPHFLALTEFAMFNSIPHPCGGFTVNYHEHAIIFGDLKKATYAANRQRKNYPPNSTEAQAIHIKSITDLSAENIARVAAYMLKAPSQGINYRPPLNGKEAFVNKSEKGDRYIRYLRMAQLRSMVSFEDCCYAGGDGKEVRRKLVNLLRALSKSDASPSKMLLHPDEIPSFWVDFAKEIGRDRWALPIIKRRA